MADIDPAVKRKQVEEIVEDARALLAASVRALLAKIKSGDATAADFNAAARLIDLLGLDRLTDLSDAQHSEHVRRQLEELDREAASEGW
jgi:hypothetical protein